MDRPAIQVDAWQRQQLVWIDSSGWADLRARGRDCEARELLAHWHARCLPLVATCSRAADPAGLLAVGLAAPWRWARRRLALEIAPERVLRVGFFPTLTEVARQRSWARAGIALAGRLARHGATARVYGSFGWEQLSGESYVLESSDLDLLVEVAEVEQAAAVVNELRAARLGPRIDGEFMFPRGLAVPWPEMAQLLAGQARQVLAKHRDGVRLLGWDALHAWCAGANELRVA